MVVLLQGLCGFLGNKQVTMKIFLTLLLSIMCFAGAAQKALMPFKDSLTGKYGFKDARGKVMVKAMFSEVGEFSEGLAYAAILGNSYTGYLQSGNGNIKDTIGYITAKGNWWMVLPKKYCNRTNGCYYKGEPFKKGIAIMYTNERGADCADSYGTLMVDRNKKITIKNQ